MTTKEFYHKYSIPYKLLLAIDLPSVDYDDDKKISRKEAAHIKQKNIEIASTLEQRIKDAKIKAAANKVKRESN